jgi:hypothetical protein
MFSSNTVPGDSHFQQKHQIRHTERPLPLVLVVVHRGVQTVDAITIIHLTICNNNGNNTLSTKKYSARFTHLKPKQNDTKEYARFSFCGLTDSFAKQQKLSGINYFKYFASCLL